MLELPPPRDKHPQPVDPLLTCGHLSKDEPAVRTGVHFCSEASHSGRHTRWGNRGLRGTNPGSPTLPAPVMGVTEQVNQGANHPPAPSPADLASPQGDKSRPHLSPVEKGGPGTGPCGTRREPAPPLLMTPAGFLPLHLYSSCALHAGHHSCPHIGSQGK